MKPSPPFLRLPFLPLLLAAFLLMAPVFLAGKAMFWGTPLLQFVPWWAQAWRTLLSGHLPLWNPLVGMGAPLLANYQSALLYPFHWIYLTLFAAGGVPLMAWGQAPLVALHLAWAGTGMALLARRLGLGILSQAVCGLAFGLSGYLVSRAAFLSINAAVAWLPWVILCLTPAHGQAVINPRRFLALVVCLALQVLAGHAQTAWYTLLLAALWAGFWAWNAATHGSSPARRVASAWSRLFLAVLLAAALAAIQLLPTAEYLRLSHRSTAVDYEFAMTYSFWPWHLLTLLAPGLYGSPVTGDYWGYANYWEDAIYVGLLPFLLALGAFLGTLKPLFQRLFHRQPVGQPESDPGRPSLVEQRLVWFLILLIVLALLLALGKNTPLFPWLYQYLPTFSMFQAPARFMLWAEFALALLAALGAQRWRRPHGWGLYWTRLGTAGAVAVMLGAGLAWLLMGDISPSFVRAASLAGLWGVAAGLLALSAPSAQPAAAPPVPRIRAPSRRLAWFAPPSRAQEAHAGASQPYMSQKAQDLWTWGVALLVAIDLLVAGWGLNPGEDLQLYGPAPNAAQVSGMAAGGRLYLPKDDAYSLMYERFLRFDAFDTGEDWTNLRAVMLPNMNSLDNISSANNFDPLVPGLYAKWMESLAQAGPPARAPMLDIMDVTLVETINPAQPYGVDFTPSDSAGFARWVPCVRYVSNEDEALRLISTGAVDPRRDVIRLVDAAEVWKDSCSASQSAALEILPPGSNPNLVQVTVHSPSDGWLFFSQTWYPGWRATLDGQPRELYRANYMFTAMWLPLGEYHVVLSYQPLSFRYGFIISLVAIFLYAYLWYKHA